MAEDLDRLLSGTAFLWRGSGMKGGRGGGAVSSGYTGLDALLPGGGWPAGVVVEVCCPRPGIGELQLWLPLMRQVTQAGRFVAWVAPPFLPHAVALAQAGVVLERLWLLEHFEQERERFWSAERLLRLPVVGLVLIWAPRLSVKVVRRLQLAVAAGGGVGVLFVEQRLSASPAPLRLRLAPRREGLQVEVVKVRGGRGGCSVSLALFDSLGG